ncbi:MAG TPA: urease accessory UreF family protein [Burkholderiaceae bacterium]|nr:urease accessory UreF family protein [Burkholderiaceae bacterium]
MNPGADALLRLMWLASPALPVGGFSYSEGLEAAVECGQVHDEAGAAAWLADQLHLALGRADLPLVAAAHAAWAADDAARLEELNGWALTTRETQELRAQTEQMGRSMLEWLRVQEAMAATPAGTRQVERLAALAPAPAWPLAFALAAWRTGAAAREATLAYGFAWAENMVQAALKAVPLGQNAGQRILAALVRELPAVVDTALARPQAKWQAFTPMLALRSSHHETQYSRLFRS